MTFSWYLELLSRKEILNLRPLAKQLSFLVFIPGKKMISNNPDFSITIFFKAVIVTQKRVKDGIGLNDFWRISKAIFNVGCQSFDITGQEGFQLPSSILSPLQLIRNLCKGVDVCLQSLQELSCFLQSLQGRDGSINSRSYHGKVKITSLKLY